MSVIFFLLQAKLKVYESKWSQSFSVDTIGNTGVIICYDKERKMKYRVSSGNHLHY
jgi:hypothetical protein